MAARKLPQSVVRLSARGAVKTDAARAGLYGGKGANLWWLFRRGFSVPATLLVPRDIDSTAAYAVARAWGHDLDVPRLTRFIVRSSALLEDSEARSAAGEFLTVPDVALDSTLKSALQRVRAATGIGGGPGPAIIQVQVAPRVAGVLFPTHPIRMSRAVSVVECIRGSGAALVRGTVPASSFEVTDSGSSRISGEFAPTETLLVELRQLGVQIESLYGQPSDIEWAQDKYSTIWLLQIRPIANFARVSPPTLTSASEDIEFRKSPKVLLRRLASSAHVRVSPAWILRTSVTENAASLSRCIRSIDRRKEYSVVAMSPATVNGNVVRQFGHGASLQLAVQRVVRAVRPAAWNTALIIKEVLQSEFTGIASKDDQGFWIELAEGHFVPKGVVPVSRFRLAKDGITLTQSNIQRQRRVFDVTPKGASARAGRATGTVPLRLLRRIVRECDRIWRELAAVIEFGIDAQGRFQLLDYIPSPDSSPIRQAQAEEGILSPGSATATLIRVDDSEHEAQSVDWHAHNAAKGSGRYREGIFFARLPYLSLMDFLELPQGRVGFVFETPSLLSHIMIQIRERGIPAVCCPESELAGLFGKPVTIDALTVGIPATRRVQLARSSNRRK